MRLELASLNDKEYKILSKGKMSNIKDLLFQEDGGPFPLLQGIVNHAVSLCMHKMKRRGDKRSPCLNPQVD